MSNADKIKDLISREIANFLVSESVKPLGIDIVIAYPQSNAHLHITAEKIAEEIKERKKVY